MTFEGRRAGEGYFSSDGTQLVFQSEREPGNPFFQIYVMDLETGDIERVSPGQGKTTCAWMHPKGRRVLFASTHADPQSLERQREEIALRESGQERRYSWDYDPQFEIYDFNRDSGQMVNLTETLGYDAEGSWSPDGQLIAFTSNRRGYEGTLTEEEKKNFDIDPAYLNDIYLMNTDGSDVRRLTSAPGYDGGPFFSPDGQRICWRRFSPNGALAEVWTMNIDGSDQRQLTRLGSMSWAPFYHPSGEYLIFTTNRHGFSNFELYLIDVEGKSTPVRVTHTNGFDGLPVFTPDGNQLVWTTNRTAAKRSQLFVADWNHDRARELLALTNSDRVAAQAQDSPVRVAASSRRQSTSAFSAGDVMRHVDYLCREELEGRLTGTRGELMATAYVAAYLDSLGLVPAGDNGTWFQEFEFTSGVALGPTNTLTDNGRPLEVNRDWRPLSFSGTGNFEAAGLAFAGYGMVVPASDDHAEYDSYVHLDVTDKWVVVLRYLPEDITAEQRQHLSRASQLRFKATFARDRGARGLIVVSGPNSKANDQLVPLRLDGALSGSSLPVISVTDRVAQRWLQKSDKQLSELQDKLDTGAMMMGFDIEGVELAAEISVKNIKATGRNVLGRLQVGQHPTAEMVVVGAHIDHLGKGASSSSLARGDESQGIHYGADDNASGVAAMLEIAEYLTDQTSRGKLVSRRDVVFAAWSGEELGLIGSNHFVKSFAGQGTGHPPHGASDKQPPHAVHPTDEGGKQGGADPQHAPPHASSMSSAHGAGLHDWIAAYVNMDMVGRLDKSLILQGVGSSQIWRGEIERRNAPVGLPIVLQEDSYLPTDASSFYMQGVPVLSAFTGSHSEYHTPRDTPDTLNYEGAAKVARLMGLITRSLMIRDAAPDYVAHAAPENSQRRASLRAYLGTIPDYAEEVVGVKLGGVAARGPADKAGIKAGDVIVEVGGKKIENIYDYTFAIEGLKIGQPVKITVVRQGKRIPLDVVPGSRE